MNFCTALSCFENQRLSLPWNTMYGFFPRHCNVTIVKSTPRHYEKKNFTMEENVDNKILLKYNNSYSLLICQHVFFSLGCYTLIRSLEKNMNWPHQNAVGVQCKANAIYVRECKAVFLVEIRSASYRANNFRIINPSFYLSVEICWNNILVFQHEILMYVFTATCQYFINKI